MNAKFRNKIRHKNRACKPARGTVECLRLFFSTKNTKSAKIKEQLNSTKKVGVGKPTAKTTKNSISPKPMAEKKVCLSLNLVYKNTIKNSNTNVVKLIPIL